LGKISATAAFIPPVLETTPLVSAFLSGAVNDTLHRTNGSRLDEPLPSAISDWISAEKLDSIVVSQPTVGFTRDFLDARQLSVPPRFFVRDWDRKLWPHATAGFFRLKAALPKIHAALAPKRGDDLFPDF
jgi:deoxyribodipyrimidine photo-lyase